MRISGAIDTLGFARKKPEHMKREKPRGGKSDDMKELLYGEQSLK